MKVILMEFFDNFTNTIMDGKEHNTFVSQVKLLALEEAHTGLFEQVIKVSKSNRVLVINYYMSQKLDRLFVLTAHIQRGGEPRTKEKQELQKYLAEIQGQERGA